MVRSDHRARRRRSQKKSELFFSPRHARSASLICGFTAGTLLFGAVEKPFNFYETPGKLPKEVVPTEYSIRVVPDIDNFTFAGSETVKLNVRSPVRQLVFNALELKIEAASLDGKDLLGSAIRIDKETELLTLALPQELPAGDHSLKLRFTGKINK